MVSSPRNEFLGYYLASLRDWDVQHAIPSGDFDYGAAHRARPALTMMIPHRQEVSYESPNR